MINLNTDLNIEDSLSPYTGAVRRLTDPSVTSGAVTCHFRNVKNALLQEIMSHNYVIGCVAWLTDKDILQALATRHGVAIVIQKEDFLRPDSGRWTKNKILKAYNSIAGIPKHWLPNPLASTSDVDDDGLVSIRCVGNSNRSKSYAHPRSHHKFVVFGDMVNVNSQTNEVPQFKPESTWTGSFNFTNNSSNSLENAVVIKDITISEAYAFEFSQVCAMSEPLDWKSSWSSPEYRIGT